MAFDFRKGWKFWIFLGILVVVILGVAIVSLLKFKPIQPSANETLNKTENNPYVEPSINAEFEKGNEWVKVFVGLKSKENREEVISQFSESEIKIISFSLRGDSFSAEITQKGLEILRKNPNVEWLNLYPKSLGVGS